jgi:SAM-dependent methyltransferase
MMNPRIVTFLLAIGALTIWRLTLYRHRQADTASVSAGAGRWQPSQLLLASFLTIFLELAVIRWIAVEVRIFAYIKNLALLVCFLGFGLGCALAHNRVRWLTAAKAFLGLLIVVRWPWQGGRVMEGLSQALGSASDVEIWGARNSWNWAHYILAAAVASVLLFLITYIFVPLGQTVSRQIEAAPSPLYGYSWNLAGSLIGILGFLGVCRLMLPPTIWFGIGLAGFALLQLERRDRYLMASLIVPAALLLHDSATKDHFMIWSPYQQIEFTRMKLPDGGFLAANLFVNHTGYQYIVNLSPQFLARYPNVMGEPPDENSYNFPYRFAKTRASVLIVGAGAGNDVAAALRNGSGPVDAVDIDPAILALGRSQHPERPYDSPQVAVHLTDARNFLKRSQNRYDLIVFGALDSHTEFSDYSNMRLDNFVYTLESLREARDHLAPEGVLFLKFQVNRPWMGERLLALLIRSFGKPPLIFRANLTAFIPSTCFVISSSDRVEKALAADPRLAELVARNGVAFTSSSPVPVTTDDWPYLYQEGRWIPRTYVSVALLVGLLGLALYWQIPEARSRAPSLFFLGMGAGFLLLETQAISRLALYFGTTWQVNAIAIGMLLATLLLANVMVELKPEFWRRSWTVLGLLGSLLIAYLIPFSSISGSTGYVGSLVALAFTVPVFFAGLLFAEEFRTADSPSSALAANMLGAVCGGLLENLSLVVGMRALLLITISLYLLAACGLRWRNSPSPQTVSQS